MLNPLINCRQGLFLITGMVLFLLPFFTMAELDSNVPIGWAAVSSRVGRAPIEGTGMVESTIGGGNGRLVEASGGQIGSYASSSEPLVIMASGSCGGFTVASNKTIIGVGGGLTVKGQVTVDGVSNVILRNIKISGGTDAISASLGTHHLWIDHCDVSNCGDGLIDMKRGADKISISWVRFSKHHKTMLINHGKNIEIDNDRLNITLHHNFWDGSNTRNPRVGFGQVHILNCYYNGNSGYGIHTYWNTEVRIERNYFNNVRDAVSDHKGSTPGTWPGPGYVVLIDNYTNVSGSIKKKTTTDPDRIFHVEKVYMYDWIVTDVQQVPDVVKGGAGVGSQWGKLGAIPTPGQGAAQVPINQTLKWTKVGSEASNKVYFGTTNPPPEVKTVAGYSYNPGKLNSQTVYYWKINNGKVWKFKTGDKAVGVRPNFTSDSGKAGAKPVAFQKGKPGQSTILIGDEAGRLHDIKGRNRLNLEEAAAKAKKRAGE